MKLTGLLLLLLLFIGGCGLCMAKIRRDDNKFSLEKEPKNKISNYITEYTWNTTDNKEYPIHLNSKGKFYIMKVSSKTGKEYIYYLPKEAQEELKKAFIEDNPDMKDIFH